MKKVLMFIAMFMVIPVMALAASNVTFTWDANGEADLAGYKIYQADTAGGQVIGSGNEIADLPAGTETTTVVVEDGTWYWVVTAYDLAGNESPASNEETKTLDTEAPQPPTNLWITLIEKIIAFLQNWMSSFRAV